ncbi:MAG: RNA methyltransferase [Longicatena sp.]
MEQYIVEGNISVKAALLANKRPIEKIIVDEKKRDKDTSYILRKAKELGVLIESVDRNIIDTLAQGKTHGGLLAVCGEREFQSLNDIIKKEDVFLALVEGIEDPFNFGYVLRSLYAAGCDGVIIPPRNWTSAASVVTKSSAGASEYLNLIVADDMEQLLNDMKKEQITFVCGQRSDAISLYDYDFPSKVCIAIGGEMRGLSKLVLSASDQNLCIPYRTDFKNAMNAAASTAIFAFELVRQRNKKE